MFQGSKDAKILFVSDFLRKKEVESGEVLAGERKDILINALNSAGILSTDYAFTVIHPSEPKGSKVTGFTQDERIEAQRKCKELINESQANIIVPLGDYALRFITGLDYVSKHHLSLYQSKADFKAKKCMSLFHPETVQKSYELVSYIRYGCVRLKEEMSTTLLNIPERKLLISLDLVFDEQVGYLENIIKNAQEVSTDVETGNGCVNTVGFGVSPTEAIALESLPSGKTPAQFRKLWELYKTIWESDNIGKIAQNGLFESTWAAMYGIEFKNLTFDTMWAMKFIHPALERGLDNVGRIYTKYPYWKDDHSDWNDVRNWRQHLEYNCKDNCGQFAAKVNMQKDLDNRRNSNIFHSFIMPQFPVANEMQLRGLRLDERALDIQRKGVMRDIDSITEIFNKGCEERVGRKVNLNSPKQVKVLLKEIGLKLPTIKGKESTTKGSLMKLKNKYPKEPMVREILKIDQLTKQLDEYLNFDYDQDGRIRSSYDLASSETGEWIGKKSIFDKGFDATDVPRVVKSCIIADEGMSLIELRMNQPDIRVIAANAPEYKLQEMLADYKNVPKYLASKLFKKPEELINKNEISIATQVIKSTNEMDSPKQFVEKCFARTSVFFQDLEAKRMMQIFLEEFPGCRKRIEDIKKQIYSKRMIKGVNRSIVYYDRVNDALFRRALAFDVDAYVNDKMTSIIFKLKTVHGVEFLTRNKTSVLIQIPSQQLNDVLGLDFEPIVLDVSYGERWGTLANV